MKSGFVCLTAGLLLLILSACGGIPAAPSPTAIVPTDTPPPSVSPTSASLVPATPLPTTIVSTDTPLPSAPSTSIGLLPDSTTIAQGESISATIHIASVTDLYGVEVHLTHGDGLSAEGLVPGTCASDFIALSQTANGQIGFAAARMPPLSPFTGDCEVASFTLTGKVSGAHVIAFDTVILASKDGVALPVVIAGDGKITVE